jgi:signal transduction histidine kinase/ActR/RegA family two-component response regulator
LKVRTYLTLTATAVLVPVTIFAAASLSMLLEAERNAALRGVQETARSTALVVDRELASAEAALKALGSSPYLESGDLAGFYRQAKLSTAGQHFWIVLFDRDGQQLINTRSAYGASLPKRQHPERGHKVIDSQIISVTNLIQGPVATGPVIAVEAPVPARGGRQYVLSQAFDVQHFERAFNQPGVAPSWVIGLFDRNGITITRSRAAQQFIGKPATPQLIEAANQDHEGILRSKNLEGADNYGVFTHSSTSGWLITIGVPVDDIESAARRAVLLASAGLLAALACAAVVAIFLSRRLAQSMDAAARTAAALGQGKLPIFNGTGVDEVDTVQHALVDAGTILRHEQEQRALAEAERAQLFTSEQEARRVAESQNRAKDEFLAMLGHELRNPLGAITNAVAIMESPGLSPESLQRARAVISRQSGHLARMVDDLLDLSRVMSGKVFLNRQCIDLAGIVRNCVETLNTSRGHTHAIQIHTEPCWIDADPTRLEQIVTNLLVNACKYTPGVGKIEVTVRPQSGMVEVVVSDNGVGIAANLLPRIFDVFVQGAAPLDRAGGGLGIGLALVKRLATLHGGTVNAYSDGPGKGSRFVVQLPPATPQAIMMDASLSQAATAGEGCRILLVEDNEDNRQTLAAVLNLYGHRVTQAADGNEGLHLALSDPPDVAVVDIGLPGVDGYEVARRLRSMPATRAIGLVAVTGYGQSEDERKALDAGFDLHLVKPVEAAKLLQAIARLQPFT